MASVWLSLVLALWLIGFGCSFRITDREHFELSPDAPATYKYPLETIYALFGSGEPTVCMNLTVARPTEVRIGGCGKYVSLGFLDTMIVPLNRSIIQQSLEYGKDDYCNATHLQIKLLGGEKTFKGSMTLFQCTCTITQFPLPHQGFFFRLDPYCKPTTKTWNDRRTSIRFRHESGKVERHPISMDHTIHAAVVDFRQTMCFKYSGDSLLRLTLSKSQVHQNITVVLNSDLVYSFSNYEKALLAKMLHAPVKSGKDQWSIEIETYGMEPIIGLLNIYGCQRYLEKGEIDDANKPFKRLLPNSGTTLEGINFYFDLKNDSAVLFSADIKEYIDQATVVKHQGVELAVNITTTGPVTLLLTRCKTPERGGIVIAKNSTSNYFSVNHTDLLEYMSLSMRRPCDTSDEDDALYLHVITDEEAAVGKVCFSLIETSEDRFPRAESSFPRVSFAIANDSLITKQMNLGAMFDEGNRQRNLTWITSNKTFSAAQLNRKIVISLRSNRPIAILISKCRHSRREIIAGNVKPGETALHLMTMKRITRLLSSEKCSEMEDISQEEAYIHFETHNGPTAGTFGLVLSEQSYETHPNNIPFENLPPENIASSPFRPFEIIPKDPMGIQPLEVDINVLLHEAFYNIYKTLDIEFNRNDTTTITFSKCQHHKYRGVSFNITGGKKTFRYRDLTNLYRLTKSEQCTNTAKYGLYVHISDPTLDDVITLRINNFRQAVPNNGGTYSANGKIELHKKNGFRTILSVFKTAFLRILYQISFSSKFIFLEKSSYTVSIPLGTMDHGIGVRLTNAHTSKVNLLLTMCPSIKSSETSIFEAPMTTGYLKLDVGLLDELKVKAENCTTKIDSLYFTIRSKNAKGRITVDIIKNEDCGEYGCALGAIKFFNSTAGMIIAQ
ncbi:Protein CBG07373 [Caenorhabditis briggsae]|uniref:Protein CBG07373 n=1 Tax=Caenorhabditis briggsae TaxID=6238 RepID=A8X4X1_CAEBR|nr:Protein CBG07373 [Caenorhabditis briggsae]CAP27681.2 Protein CBG07373 [Caenorhabditis briggsae]